MGHEVVSFCDFICIHMININVRVLLGQLHISAVEEHLSVIILPFFFTLKDNEDLRVGCPVPADDGQTDCICAQQLSVNPRPPQAAELPAPR